MIFATSLAAWSSERRLGSRRKFLSAAFLADPASERFWFHQGGKRGFAPFSGWGRGGFRIWRKQKDGAEEIQEKSWKVGAQGLSNLREVFGGSWDDESGKRLRAGECPERWRWGNGR